jgi:hypothetical protein
VTFATVLLFPVPVDPTTTTHRRRSLAPLFMPPLLWLPLLPLLWLMFLSLIFHVRRIGVLSLPLTEKEIADSGKNFKKYLSSQFFSQSLD